MGQQQLLLVILVTIIVGIATVVAINVFGSSAANANRDAVRQDMLAAIANAEGFYLKPALMGGGSNSYQSTDVDAAGDPLNELSLTDLGIPGVPTPAAAPTSIVNENGEYELTAVGTQSFTLRGEPSSDPDSPLTVVVTRDATTNRPVTVWTQ